MILRRISQDSYCTRGELLDDDGQHIAVTLELPWRENEDDRSCIPEGIYRCYRRWSDRHKCFLFGIDVDGRDDIELHVGNIPGDTEGCILVGANFAEQIEDKGAGIVGSRLAFGHLMTLMAHVDEFSLTVTPPAVTYVERQ